MIDWFIYLFYYYQYFVFLNILIFMIVVIIAIIIMMIIINKQTMEVIALEQIANFTHTGYEYMSMNC